MVRPSSTSEVLGVPDPEMGERVVAVVQPRDPTAAGPELAAELTAFARTKLAGYKRPREVRFLDELPRTPTGKLRKHELRSRLLDFSGGPAVSSALGARPARASPWPTRAAATPQPLTPR